MNKIEFDTTITLRDFYEFNVYYYMKSKYRFYLSLLFYFLILAMASFSYFTNYDDSEINVIMFYVVILFPFFFMLLMWRQIKKIYKETKLYSIPTHYTIDNEMIKMTGENYNAEYKMDIIEDISITKKYVYLWQSPRMANLIPRRSLTDEQFEQLKEIIAPYKGRKATPSK